VTHVPGHAASSSSDTPDPPGSQIKPRKRSSVWRESPALIVIALVLAILIKTFLIQAFFIPSASMFRTLAPGDRILVCRICVRVEGIHRGEVIVFGSPHPTNKERRSVVGGAIHWLVQALGVAQPDNPDFVKRVIGLPGDVIELKSGQLYRNGQSIAEPYLNPPADTRSFGPIKVPAGMLFVLGDNRTQSGDSRFQPPVGLGSIPENVVIGAAFVRVWPFARWGAVR
jgi:signal peptidase I